MCGLHFDVASVVGELEAKGIIELYPLSLGVQYQQTLAHVQDTKGPSFLEGEEGGGIRKCTMTPPPNKDMYYDPSP